MPRFLAAFAAVAACSAVASAQRLHAFPLPSAPRAGFASELWTNHISTAGGAVTLKGNGRVYAVADATSAGVVDAVRGADYGREAWGALRYHRIDLRGKTLRFTVDVSRVACSNNAALYFVSMTDPSKAR